MRSLILAAAASAIVLPATAASAQYRGDYNGYNYRAVQEQRDSACELSDADRTRRLLIISRREPCQLPGALLSESSEPP